jgi:hypothetical protein
MLDVVISIIVFGIAIPGLASGLIWVPMVIGGLNWRP